MEICAKNVFKHYEINFEDNKEDLGSVEDSIGIEISTKSDLPPASGLSSSSALSNAVTLATSELIVDEFDKKPMNDLEIVNLAIDSSLEAGVTITGAFDDATASYLEESQLQII